MGCWLLVVWRRTKHKTLNTSPKTKHKTLALAHRQTVRRTHSENFCHPLCKAPAASGEPPIGWWRAWRLEGAGRATSLGPALESSCLAGGWPAHIERAPCLLYALCSMHYAVCTMQSVVCSVQSAQCALLLAVLSPTAREFHALGPLLSPARRHSRARAHPHDA